MDLRLLLVGDLHYTGSALHECGIPGRNSELGLELVRRLKRRLEGRPFNAVVFLGDIVDNGGAENAREDLAEIREEAETFGVPCFFARGNHDPVEGEFRSLTGMESCFAVIGEYLLYFFFDEYSGGDFCRRSEEDMRKFAETLERNPGKKPLVFQHNPLFADIEGDYPYNLVNAGKVHRDYRSYGVPLSVSGHYHRGHELLRKDGVGYLSVPAFCESPFPFTELAVGTSGIHAAGGEMKLTSGPGDNHCHTEFAYCGEDVNVASVCARAGLFGLEYAAFTEHAGQLYLPRENYWSGDFYRNPSMIRESRAKGADRFGAYREAIGKFPGFARPGLEVEADKDGNLTLLPEDREMLSILLGAVHFLPEASGKKLEMLFMGANEALLQNGVDAIAHPFRFFRRAKLPLPRHLFGGIARMLGEHGAAAELNFHTNEPPLEFFRACLEEGVKISIGTDTHNLLEAGDLSKHLDFLERLGVSPEKDRGLFFSL